MNLLGAILVYNEPINKREGKPPMNRDEQNDLKHLGEVIARMDARLESVERQIATEQSSGETRGQDQSRIGERVARLEATIEHMAVTLSSLPVKAGVSSTTGVGLLGGIFWILMDKPF